MHPIVTRMNPSLEQEPAILKRGQDMVVTAGAGTGKTRTLVARYLALLAEGLELRSIVAITFTRKAAREMRNRVRDEIRRYLEQPDLDDDERLRWQQLYSNLDAARIGTIHSLCTEILRSHPAEAGVDPRFEVLEEGQGNVLRSRAVDEALAWAADDARAAGLFGLLGEGGLREALVTLLEKRLDAEEAFWRQRVDLLGHWREALARQVPPGEPNVLDELSAGAIPALRATMQVALQRLEAFKGERNALDFDDLEGRALRLLEQNEAVRRYWQGAVRAILMDEFQDTNQRQRDLVDLLNDGGKLFIVGDAKQSIYRFRGADVVVFRSERARIEAEGGAHVTLRTSYRAHKELVQALNDLLCPVLGDKPDAERPWVEPFSELLHYRQEAGAGFLAPHVELHLTVGSKKDGALDRAARALVVRIAELVASGTRVMEGERSRPLGYGDVAILCRASGSFRPYEDALEEAGLPYLTVAGRGFYERPEVRDLLNALRALADPTDDLALVGLLRSPALGISDAALYRLCQAQGADRARPLWEHLRTGPSGREGSAEDRQGAERAVRLVTELHEQVGRTSVADLLKAFLDDTHYRAALIETGDARSARNVDKLLADAHTSGIVGVGEFLEYVEGLKASGAREGEARATAEGAVQIMSVHQAKGLEFPVVAIGDVTYRAPGSKGVLLDRELGVVLPLKGGDDGEERPASYALVEARSEDQEGAESDRLLYVAATRAQEKLILSGCITVTKSGAPGKLGGWLGRLGGPDALGLQAKKIPCDPGGEKAVWIPLRVGRTPVGCLVYPPGQKEAVAPPVPEGREAQEVALPPPLLAPVVATEERVDGRVAQQERIPAQRVWRVVPAAKRPRAPAWVIGSLVHEALAAWRFPEDYPAADVQHSFERWAGARARGYGLADPGQLEDAVQGSARLLVRFRAHSLYAEMAGADQRLHEVPYSLEANGQVESGILDVLYRRGQQWTLVEFKTDELRNEADLQRLLVEEDYLPQAQRYLAAVERLLGQKPRLVLCLLNFAGGIRLHDPGQAGDPSTAE